MTIKRQYFGTDGIRGTVGCTPITPDFVLRLGHAVGRVLKRREPQPVVLIGKDTRISGYMLESALESGLISAGASVVLLGPVPTPAVAYLTRAQRASLGAVISASHNPYPDNGIKFFSAQGTKLSDEWEREVEAALAEPPQWVDAAALGRAWRLDDAAGRYIEFCKSSFDNDLSLRGMKIVVDGAHGAAYQIAPKVFHELGADVVSIGCTPDGLNINQDVGATHPQALARAVAEHGADIGIALDGDADRLQIVDAQGRLYNGDELLYVIASDRLMRNGRSAGLAGVVGTLMTNLAVEQALRRQGFDFVRAKVGDRYVLEELHQRGWLLGGEGSGHLLALDKHTTGDGLISALQVLQAGVVQQRSLSDLLAGVQLCPQVLINVRLQAGTDWQSNPRLKAETEAVQDTLGTQGRVLIRASGTEPLLRLMVEAHDAAQARQCAERLAAAVARTA
jgi:phosphoglucosamine mutase